MNLAVDYNELLFLALIICLAADICYFVKDYDRSFYFYNQSVFSLFNIESSRQLCSPRQVKDSLVARDGQNML